MIEAFLEAMCAKLPVVATDVGGVCEQVLHGNTGVLVPPRNSQALSEALLKLASNPGQRMELGRRGRQRIESEFTIELSASEFEEIYESLVRVSH